MAQEQARSPEQIREQYGLDEETLLDRLKQNWAGYLFIIPTFIAFSALFYYPMLRGIMITFTDTKLGEPGTFIGLDNYVWLLTNDLFVYAFGLSIVFVAGTTFLQLTLGLVVALLLNELREAAQDWIGALIMSPYFAAPLAGGVIWSSFLITISGSCPSSSGFSGPTRRRFWRLDCGLSSHSSSLRRGTTTHTPQSSTRPRSRTSRKSSTRQRPNQVRTAYSGSVTSRFRGC